MKIRTLFLLLALAAIAVFASLNWQLFNQPSTLSLGFGTVAAPLGLVMLVLLAAVCVLFLVYIVTLQTTVLVENRRHGREMQAQRGLADQAEASRFTELRQFIEAALQNDAARDGDWHNALLARMDRLEDTVRGTMQDANNTVAAYVGELEDRMERKLPGHDAASGSREQERR